VKVLVCGSRSWTNGRAIRHRLRELPSGSTIVSGGARGADQIAATVARSLGFEVVELQANWRPDGRYNPRAGFERNSAMLDLRPDLVLAFWDGESTGTADTLEKARRRGIATEVVYD
jgi:YspA, cpYpsA-related SLOG family